MAKLYSLFIRHLDIILPIMARRPRPPDEVLSRKDLAELQRRLSIADYPGYGYLPESQYWKWPALANSITTFKDTLKTFDQTFTNATTFLLRS